MGERTRTLLLTLLLGGIFACSGNGDPGGTSSAGSSSGSSTVGGTSGGSSSGGSSTSHANSCAIVDAGSFNNGAANPSNSCQVCDPSQSASTWSPGQPCNLCHGGDGGEGICDLLGNCCTIICNDGTCNVPQGGSCQENSDCCGITAGCT